MLEALQQRRAVYVDEEESKDPVKAEFLAMLGDLGTWLSTQIEERTRHIPRDIAELTSALIAEHQAELLTALGEA